MDGDELADLEALGELARRAHRYLMWALLLLGAMGIMLVIDLQLKAALGRLAVTTAGQLDKARTEATSESATSDHGGGVAGGTRADDVGNDAANGSSADGGVSAPRRAAKPRGGRAAQRSPGDG